MRLKRIVGIGLVPVVALAGFASAQPVRSAPLTAPASNVAPLDTRSIIAPPPPAPRLPSFDPPLAFLQVARDALARGRTGETQEALERAESRLLDRSVDPGRTSSPDATRAVLDIGVARQSLAAQDRSGAANAISDAMRATSLPFVASGAAPSVVVPVPILPAPPPASKTTYALLPGHWQLDGARWVWIPPDTVLRPVQDRSLVQAEYVWRDGRWTWVPARYAQ